VILDEEGRAQYGALDDYELFLADQGYPGRHFDHGMSNNQYTNRPWHLPESTHATNWATQQMARVIKRRDPTRPAFWYLSYRHPHPPLVPLQAYLDLYRDIELDQPYWGEWSAKPEAYPYPLRAAHQRGTKFTKDQIRAARRAFYALCTHIDHQLRVIIGTLREEDVLDNTIICFTADHGDMLGNHGFWAKRLFYEASANVPLLLIGATGDARVGHHQMDDRLVGWQDIMPTLLDLAGIDIPDSVEGLSMVGEKRRDWFYGEVGEDAHATRMIHDGRYKLIYYPVGNHRQLFDLTTDLKELNDLTHSSDHADILARLTSLLIDQLYGGDESWVQNGELVGLPDREFHPGPNKGLSSQRGSHWPPPPKTDMPQIEWVSEEK
jgi:arylsulfatase A-like enzyme